MTEAVAQDAMPWQLLVLSEAEPRRTFQIDATRALVLSQVALSLTLPVPMIALVMFTRRRDLMGRFANGVAMQATVAVVALNVVLLLQTLGVEVMGPPA